MSRSTLHLRILMIVFNQVGKGTYWRAFQFGSQLVRRGCQVSLLAMSPNQRWRLCERDVVVPGSDQPLHLVETPDLLPGSLRSGWDLWDTWRRQQWLQGRDFDLVHAFEARPVVIYPALAAQGRGAVLVLDWCDWFGRGGSVEERPNPLVRTMLRPVETYYEENFRTAAQGTTVINLVLRQRAIDLGVPPRSICLLRNGSDVSIPLVDLGEARRQAGLSNDVPLIGFVGGTYERDARFMAAAFNRLQQVRPDARLVLVGYFNRQIEQWLQNPGAVIRTGPLPLEQLYPWLAACDLCWLPLCDSPANRGRWPLKLNDYMTAGRAVVASAVGDLPAVLADYQFGVTVPPDPARFAAATLALLYDPARLRLLGQAARRAAETDFNWVHLARNLENFYCSLLVNQALK